MKALVVILFFLVPSALHATEGPVAEISGFVRDEKGEVVIGASVALKDTPYQAMTDRTGKYTLNGVPYGAYTIVAFYIGKKTARQVLQLERQSANVNFVLEELNELLDEVVVHSASTAGDVQRLNAIENFGIYEGKKTEVVSFRNLTINTATNNARQIYSRITGLNIWESDGAGLQLGIGGRGLSPNRTANFNTRQNGYDISADALGYPESYYTPPAEALDQIEIVRGAASLQYGTQFGGLLNFKFKKGPADKKLEFISRQSTGSWGFFGSFNSVGGTVARGKVNYYSYYNYKRGDGYRANSGFDFHNAYASVNYQVNPDLLVNLDVTKMNYVAQQPGGLTDALFKKDPRQSIRDRNWFRVDWNLVSLNLTYKFSHLTELNVRNFGLLAERDALGNLARINMADFGGNRTLIDGQFRNIGNETRLLHRYNALGRQHALITGFRVYHGTTTSRQGDANDGTGPDFRFLNPEDLEVSDFAFRNQNLAWFAETVFDLTPKLSITPGVRVEYIHTSSEGFRKGKVFDQAGNLIASPRVDDAREVGRNFVIAGVGVSYKPSSTIELYSNLSQNYRAINFSDLFVDNPNLVVDLNIKDESGYTFDAGMRGSIRKWLSFEVTGFYVSYNDKIGNMYSYNSRGQEVRVRGNIADARNVGVESFTEIRPFTRMKSLSGLSFFVNSAVINAVYKSSERSFMEGKKVEMVPPLMLRAGTTYRRGNFTTTLQFSHTAEHFSDASNATRSASAVEGIIPAYQVVDLTAGYDWKFLRLEASCNNMLDQAYFTRRAENYPGPGIIPSEGRGFYVTLQFKAGK